MSKKQVTYVKVDESDAEIYVTLVVAGDTADSLGDTETDSVFTADEHELRRDRRAAAEQRAEVLAKLYGCEWGANY